MPEPSTPENPSWGGLVVDGLREVKEAIADLTRDMNAKMSLLVSQREFDHTRDELTIDIGELRGRLDQGLARHDADVKRLEEAMVAAEDRRVAEREAAEQRRENERKWAIGTRLTVIGLLIAAIGLAISYLPAH